jgi:hypothetical protein
VKIPTIRAMEIRIYLKKWIKWPAMRFEILYHDPNYIAFLKAALVQREKDR